MLDAPSPSGNQRRHGRRRTLSRSTRRRRALGSKLNVHDHPRRVGGAAVPARATSASPRRRDSSGSTPSRSRCCRAISPRSSAAGSTPRPRTSPASCTTSANRSRRRSCSRRSARATRRIQADRRQLARGRARRAPAPSASRWRRSGACPTRWLPRSATRASTTARAALARQRRLLLEQRREASGDLRGELRQARRRGADHARAVAARARDDVISRLSNGLREPRGRRVAA